MAVPWDVSLPPNGDSIAAHILVILPEAGFGTFYDLEQCTMVGVGYGAFRMLVLGISR